MTMLTLDLSEIDEELGDLLAHRWTACLVGEHADREQRVIAPPPSKTELTYPSDTEWNATGFVLLCDAQVVKRWPFDPAIYFRPGDSLTVVLTVLTVNQ